MKKPTLPDIAAKERAKDTDEKLSNPVDFTSVIEHEANVTNPILIKKPSPVVKPQVAIQPNVIKHSKIQPVLIEPDVEVVEKVIIIDKLDAFVDAKKVPLVKEMKVKEKSSFISLLSCCSNP